MKAKASWKYAFFLAGMISASAPMAKAGLDGSYVLPLSFEPNLGQTAGEVRFLSRGKGYTLFLTQTEAALSLRGPESAILRMRPLGANGNSRISGESQLEGEANYFRGRDPNASVTGVPTYGRVRYEEVYPGIDLVYYGNGRELEYDFVVAPGADPERIRLQFEGAEKLSVNGAGELLLKSAAGELQQAPPSIYQEIDGVRRPVAGGYRLMGEDRIAFRLGAYDRTRPLVIDPVLAYSTYFGGSSDEIGWDVAVDGSGNAYIVGTRPSVRTPDAQDFDAFVAKFTPAGTLLWTTDVGDRCDDDGRSLAVDSTGSVYLTGQLGGICYPYPTLNPGAFVAKLNATGGGSYMFPFSGPYGGADVGQAVAVDGTGNAYITGVTSSDDFPTTPEAFQPNHSYPGIADGFVVKVNAAGSALLYATYLGGSGHESANDIAIDGAGNVYVAGSTESWDFPTRNAFQAAHHGWGPADDSGFVSKLNAAGSDLVYSTYLGGGPNDIALGIAVDSFGSAYVTGVTESVEFPVTPGVVQPQPGDDRWCYNRWCTDAFITKLNASGTALVYSTYLGAELFEEGSGIAVDAAGNAFVTGNTRSANFPLVDAFQPAVAGEVDGFVAKLNPTGSAFVYSSYLGGSKVNDVFSEGEDSGIRIAVDGSGASAYVVGMTRSFDFPVVNAQQSNFGGGICGEFSSRCADAFLTKVGLSCTFTISPTSQAFPAPGGAGTVTVTASSNTCTRTATSSVPWITITSGANGTGSGTVGYSVAANPNRTSRTGTLIIAGRTFTVSQAAASALSVAVTAPNGGEKLFTGTPYTISWTAAGASSFDVAVSADNGATFSSIAGCTGLPGTARSCVWAAPDPVTSTARIRVTARDAAGAVSDVSNAAFTIVTGTASLTVTFPNKAVNVGIGSTQIVKWTHNLGAQSLVRIELSRDGGLTFPETLVAQHKNAKASSGSYDWLVSAPATAGAQARIRVTWTSGPASDASNVSFTIAPVFLSVVAPATGSSWGFDTTQKQTWTTNLGAADRVNVQLSTTGIGGPFTTMSGGANITASLKQAKVVVPGTATTTARVRVVWANPPAGFSATGNNPGNFKIEAPFVSVTAPAAGALWTIGSSKTIQWTSNLGVLEKVEIRLSKDGGATYPIQIIGSTPSDGKHPVTVSSTWGTQSTSRVQIRWIKTPTVSGQSATFTIQP